MKLVEFQLVGGGGNIVAFVNSELVTYIQAYQNDRTIITFGKEHAITVKGDVASVASALFNAIGCQ